MDFFNLKNKGTLLRTLDADHTLLNVWRQFYIGQLVFHIPMTRLMELLRL